MTAIYAILCSLCYGCADFAGGLAARRSPVFAVAIVSQLVGAVTILALLPIMGGADSFAEVWKWGMSAGIVGSAGVVMLYHGLATGYAAIVSPLSALTSAVIPVLFGLILGERPDAMDWAGIALAVPAVLLLSMGDGKGSGQVSLSIRWGLLSGLGFAGFFILISRCGENSGMAPLVAARMGGIPVLLGIAFIRRQRLVLVRGSRLAVLGAGILDMGANVFFLLAVRSGLLIIATTITALYPAPTVLLQRLLLGEKITALRLAGLVLAVLGVVFIAAGP